MRIALVSGLLAAVYLSLSPATARADAAPFPYPVRKIDPQVRFDNLDQYPDWIFYLEYRRGNGNPGIATKQTLSLPSAEPVALTGSGRRVVAYVLAVPRASVAGKGMPPPEDTPGVLRRQIYGIDLAEMFLIDLNDSYITPYRVSVAGADLKVEASPRVPVRPEIDLGFARLPMRQTGVVLALALAVAGMWFAWSRRRKFKRNKLAEAGLQ
jgi:hypothetical protein